MRKIGTVPNEKLGGRLVDYLLTEGIRSHVESDGDVWALWINHEDHIDDSRTALTHFLASPDDSRYLGHAAKANAIRSDYKRRQDFARKNYRQGYDIWGSGPGGSAGKTPLTFALIAICVGVALWTGLGGNQQAWNQLSYVNIAAHEEDPGWDWTDPIDASIDIRNGEFWRVITPNFLHLNFIHIFFNMMWLNMLGGQIETRKGKAKLLGMVLVLAAASSFVQVFVSRYPFFGGMSGVVYGLFGYIWMKSRFDPADGLNISQSNIQMMLIWFAICFLPGMAIANGGHAGGLVLGVIMGYVSSSFRTHA